MNLLMNTIKRKFLSDFFLSNKTKISSLTTAKIEEKSDVKSNYKYTINTPWLDILKLSKDIFCLVLPVPFEQSRTGFKADQDIAQNLLDVAINKKILELSNELDDVDEDILYEAIRDYIVMNNMQKKHFYDLIRKIRVIEIDLLPNIF